MNFTINFKDMKLFTARDLQVQHKYRFTHRVEKVKGVEVDLRDLEKHQMVIWGDGETFYYLLTEKQDWFSGIDWPE